MTERGGPTSHTAIISRQLGIPCVVGAAGVMEIAAGTLAPGRRDGRHRRHLTRRRRGRAPRSSPTAPPARRWPRGAARARPPTARRVKILANVADGESARSASSGPGRGRGAVPHRAVLPQPRRRAVRGGADVDLRRGARAVRRRRYVVVRTLDAGSDKPVAFATHEGEENPALGVRGLRLSFDNPGLLDPPARRHRRGGSRRPAPRPG